MRFRRLLLSLAMLTVLFAPFGRVAAAEAMAISHSSTTPTYGHCDEIPMPPQHHNDGTSEASIDCLIACSAMATAEATSLPQSPVLALLPVASPLLGPAGRHPEADPPPPRTS